MIQYSDLLPLVDAYCNTVEKGLYERWDKLPIELYDSETYEAIGGLLARQTTLSIQFMTAPSIWNAHMAPIIMRCMMDALITIQWILRDPSARAKKYVLYGLGQQKLYIENMKAREDHDAPEIAASIDSEAAWLNSQRRDFLTEVNVGRWPDLSTRDMAKDCGLDVLYKFAYTPFSGVAHNMWHHISRFNLKFCRNPLHNFHKVPTIAPCPIELEYAVQSAQHLDESFCAVDEAYSLEIDTVLPYGFLVQELNRLDERTPQNSQDQTGG